MMAIPALIIQVPAYSHKLVFKNKTKRQFLTDCETVYLAKQNENINATNSVADNDFTSLRKTSALTGASEEMAACMDVRSRSDHMLHKKGSVLNVSS